MTELLHPKRGSRRIFPAVLLFAGNILLFLTLWLLNQYDQIRLDQFLFQLKSPMEGTNTGIAGSAVLLVGGLSLLATAVELLLYRALSGRWQRKPYPSLWYSRYRESRFSRLLARGAYPISVTLFAAAMVFFCDQLDVGSYLISSTTQSDFIKKHYVSPYDVTLTFPEEKRNLVYIFLESMENTYADVSAGGPITEDYIPELTALAKENVSFSHSDGIGGALAFNGTTWTAAAMVAQTSGLVVKVPLTADNYGGEDAFLPGVVSLGEILAEEGYSQTLLLGSDAAFAGRDSYFTEHGNYDIIDINALKEAGRLPEDYWQWWGYEDQKLFAFAKEELTRLSESDEPFNFTMLTADTHFPDGYRCELCGDAHGDQYANVLSCSARQVSELVQWIKEQPFYENTTIIISGDHLTMDPAFLEGIDENFIRTTYNCIINAPVAPVKTENRKFGTFDLFPTTLAAMGVEIEGDRLGLGTNLFSEKRTLTERYGYKALDRELQKNSEFYNTRILGMEE